MGELSEWINPHYLSRTQRLATNYRRSKPFPHLALTAFLRQEKAIALAHALEQQSFERKESDLFSFWQTGDLLQTRDATIKEFLALIKSKEFRAWMQTITGVELRAGNIDAMGVIYGDTDHLLCHDDQLEGRKIAYILNLSPNFTARSGGALALLDSNRAGRPGKVRKRIVPEWNTLSFFTVTPRSHHMVEEVLEDKQRLTIGGWLHG